MSSLRIEHVNVTVSDPERAARLMESLFGWHVRWQGPARDGGRTIHVGSDAYYIAPIPAAASPMTPTISPRAGRSTISASRSTTSMRPRPRSRMPGFGRSATTTTIPAAGSISSIRTASNMRWFVIASLKPNATTSVIPTGGPQARSGGTSSCLCLRRGDPSTSLRSARGDGWVKQTVAL